MKFDVVWSEEALTSLASFWLNADPARRQRITQANDRLDKRLAADPHHEGESRFADKRIVFEYPLIAYFRVEANNKTTTVLQVFEY